MAIVTSQGCRDKQFWGKKELYSPIKYQPKTHTKPTNQTSGKLNSKQSPYPP